MRRGRNRKRRGGKSGGKDGERVDKQFSHLWNINSVQVVNNTLWLTLNPRY